MKTLQRIFPLLLLAVLLSSCLEERCESQLTYVAYEPVVVSPVDYRTDIEAEGPRGQICQPSGFYVYGQYLMVTDRNIGLHILDNSDPTSPRPLSFLPVAGAAGLAVRNDILYLNNYTDLVAFSLADPVNPTMLSRTEDVFEIYSVFTNELTVTGIVVDYVETEATRFVDCTNPNFGNDWFFVDNVFFGRPGLRGDLVISAAFDASGGNESSGNFGNGGEQVGIGGSLARFTIANGTLYAVDENQLKTFDLGNPAEPAFQGNIELDWGVETIFPSGDELYIGTNSGMHIYGIDDPLNPVRLSSMEHVRACDPVVVSGGLAYVTLRGGTFCGGFSNQLEIVDVRNPSSPQRLEIYPMEGPAGLSVADGKLFVCNPELSFRVYDLDDDGMLGEQLTVDRELRNAMDVIALPWLDQLITIGSDGVNQLSYAANGTLTGLSHIDICPDI